MGANNDIPKVSIGMPVYNGERFIRKAINSLLAQTFTDFELILSDNASTDKTEEICKEYADRDRRIRYFRQSENKDPLFNFEFVLQEARGKYFMWAAHDDYWSNTFISDCVKVFSSNNDCVSVFSHIHTIDLISNEILSSTTPISSSSQSAFLRCLINIVQKIPCLIYGLHKVEVIRKINMEKFDWSDVYFIFILSFYGKILIIPEFLYKCGSLGIRKPFSLTGKYLDFKTFRKKSGIFLKINFPFIKRIVLIIYIYIMSYKSEKYFRKIKDNL